MSAPNTGELKYWVDGLPAEGGSAAPVQPSVGTLKYWIDGLPESYVGPELGPMPNLLILID